MEVDDRRSTLPSLGPLRLDRILEDDTKHRPRYQPEVNMSGPQLPSPATTIQSAPSTSFSYSSSMNSSMQSSGYISPPDSRRTTKDESEHSLPRQSLPSIHEALSHNPLPYSAPPPSNPLPSEQPPPPPSLSAPAVVPPARSFLGGPQGPPNPFAQPSMPASATREQSLSHAPVVSPSQPPQPPPSQPTGSFPAINGVDSRSRPVSTYGGPRSPRQAASAPYTTSTGRSSPALSNSYISHASTSPTSYTTFRPPYPPSSHPQHPAGAVSIPEEPNRQYSANWKYDNPQKYPPPLTANHGHTDSVKRHLDIYETEMALNDVLEGSGRIFDLAKVAAARFHQNQRSEYPLEALPPLSDVDEMMKEYQRSFAGIERIRNSIIQQQQQLENERTRYYRNLHEDEMNGYHDELKGNFATGDAKKRRGKAAPPGRCHSCNRAETPEWRRGPDGARTLCNACGLHYAKLTRKNGANKGAPIGSSNLRPKNEM